MRRAGGAWPTRLGWGMAALAAVAVALGPSVAAAQGPAPLSVTLEFNGSPPPGLAFTANPSDPPISLLLTIENVSGAPITTTEGFSTREFWRRLIFTDRQGRVVINAAEALVHAYLRAFQCLSRKGLLQPTGIPVVPVEVLPTGFFLQYTIDDARTLFDLSRPGRYAAKALIPFQTVGSGGASPIVADCDQLAGRTLLNVGSGTTLQGFDLESSALEFFIVNTPVGSPVPVSPEDPNGATPVQVTFSNVTQAGDTNLTTTSGGPPPPGGFQLGAPPIYYDLTTTAGFSGPVEVCISYGQSGTGFLDPSQLRLYHFEDPNWVDATTSLDLANQVICGEVSTLSPFAVLEPTTAQAEDMTPPVIALRTPAANATYLLRQVVQADYDCQDEAGGSGLRSCVGTVPDGAPIDTHSLGNRSFTVRAEDEAGNDASATRQYRVALAKLVNPVLECVSRQGSNFLAHFGYNNPNSVQLAFPIGHDNNFTPGPDDRGQPTVFGPGRKRFVFSVPFTLKSPFVLWKLGPLVAVATPLSKRCP